MLHRRPAVTLAFITLLVILTARCDEALKPAVGSLRIVVGTTGFDRDPDGYRLTMNGDTGIAVGLNDTLSLDVAAGEQTAALTGLAVNCVAIGGLERTVAVRADSTADVQFDVHCLRMTGRLAVDVVTSGAAPDPDGYEVAVDGLFKGRVPATGYLDVPEVAVGDRVVELRGVAGNCTVGPANPTPVRVEYNVAVPVAFEVTCPPGTASIRVTTVTTGADPDPDGYLVCVDDSRCNPLPPNGSFTFSRLVPGSHVVGLGGEAANCRLTTANPLTVSVVADGLAEVAFVVACTAWAGTGSVRVTTTTTGAEFDADGYRLTVDGALQSSIGVNGTAVLHGLLEGNRLLGLGDVAANCRVTSANPMSVNVVAGDTADVAFTVICEPTTGLLRITVATSGVELDPDGYYLSVDEVCQDLGYYCTSLWAGLVAVTDTVEITVPAGNHTVRLDNVASNCVSDGNPRGVTVLAGGTTSVTFAVTCLETGGVRVTATTTGADWDPDGYYVQLQPTAGGSPYGWLSVPPNGATTFTQVRAGTYAVAAMGVAANCAVGAVDSLVNVVGGATTDVALQVACVALGRVQITASTTGADLDPDGYSGSLARAGFTRGFSVGTNATLSVDRMAPGDYAVTLDLNSVAPNCDVTSANPQFVTVGEGGTADAMLSVTCAPATPLAIVMPLNGVNQIHTLKANGTGLVRLTSAGANESPAWSAAAGRIAFSSTRDGNTDIYIMNADGSGQARLTTSAGMDVHPTWSPDGTRIAFVSTRDGNSNIYVMNADGSGQTRLTSDSAPDYDPAWSPDGSRIVFASTRDLAAGALFLMNPDGSNVTRLPSSIGGERLPTWSPDGTRLAAVRDWIGVVQLDATGTAGTVLVPADGTITGMSWSPDGRWLAYGVTACDYYYGGDCIARVMALSLDGTRRTLIMSDAREPTWPR